MSEIEFCTPYVVAEEWVVARMLRFMHAKNCFSDTLSPSGLLFKLNVPVPSMSRNCRVRAGLTETRRDSVLIPLLKVNDRINTDVFPSHEYMKWIRGIN